MARLGRRLAWPFFLSNNSLRFSTHLLLPFFGWPVVGPYEFGLAFGLEFDFAFDPAEFGSAIDLVIGCFEVDFAVVLVVVLEVG